jgi:hypothetical protein
VIVTVNAQGPPFSPKQTTLVVPIGKKESGGGLQAIVPHADDDDAGTSKCTTLPHWLVSSTSVMSVGQSISQFDGETVTVAVNVLSTSNSSLVSLVTVAVLLTPAPVGAFEST